MTLSRVERAARSNALWCDSMCRAHGVPGEMHESAWLNRRPVPRYYPNLVTLASQAQTDAQLALIRSLVVSNLPGQWVVKDSFCALDLDQRGFRLLFESNWIWRDAYPLIPNSPQSGTEWIRLQSAADLAKWETAWNGGSPYRDAYLFSPALLADPAIAFIAGIRGDRIIAGAVANRTEDVVGLSNVFTPPENRELYWAGCAAAVMQIFPELPLAGYEDGVELDAAKSVGFEKLHALRVWQLKESPV